MKRMLFCSFSCLVVLLIASCANELSDSGEYEDYALTDQVLKIESTFEEIGIKIENGIDVTDEHNELKKKVKMELDNGHSKIQAFTRNSGRTVGVFKNGSCGPYPVLHVYMDCEDSRPLSLAQGWTGDSSIDNRQNANLFFCVVDGLYFTSLNNTFGVLALSSPPSGVSYIKRNIDNEDSGNHQFTILNGQTISNSSNSFTYGLCSFWKNTMLSFYYYMKDESASGTFPNIGISYGVLGTFGTDTGRIFTDDEDSSNGNFLSVINWNSYTNTWDTPYNTTGDFHGLIYASHDTRIHISRAR